MKIDISKTARQSLKKSNKRILIGKKITELAANSNVISANVIKLKKREGYRLRVQDRRIIFRIEDDILHIDEIEPRGSVYEDRS